jgi:hypothetical protein
MVKGASPGCGLWPRLCLRQGCDFVRAEAAACGGHPSTTSWSRGCEIIELKQSPKKVSDSSEPDTFFSGIIVL